MSHVRASAMGASRTTRPSSIITTRSAIASARSTRCSERTTAHLRLLDRGEKRLGTIHVELGRSARRAAGAAVAGPAPTRGRRAAARRRRPRTVRRVARCACADLHRARLATCGQICVRRDGQCSRDRTRPRVDARHHDLVPGFLEDRRDDARRARPGPCVRVSRPPTSTWPAKRPP